MLAEGGTGSRHQALIGRSKSSWGPFEPVLTTPSSRNETGRGVLSRAPGTPISSTSRTAAGGWYSSEPVLGFTILGRVTFLAPVTWTREGWPVVNGNRRAALEVEAPR